MAFLCLPSVIKISNKNLADLEIQVSIELLVKILNTELRGHHKFDATFGLQLSWK